MNNLTLLEVFEDINGEYILSAQNMLGYTGAAKRVNARTVRPLRRAFICIAAVLALLLSSLTVAMAVSEDVREFIFSIFRVDGTEKLPDNTDVEPQGGLEEIGGSNFEDTVTTRYFKGSGIIMPSEGIIYTGSSKLSQFSFYELRDGNLSPMETKRVEFPYSFHGTDFNIKFDYTVYNGEPHFRVFPEKMDQDPYRYGWNIYSAGTDDLAWLTLPDYDSSNGLYPMLLNLETGEVTDILAGLDLTGIVPDQWEFSGDMSFALLSGWNEDDDDGFWICDIGDCTLTSLGDLTGREIIDCYLMDGESVICHAKAGEGFDVIRFDPTTGETATLVEGTEHYYLAGGSGYREIEYYGGQGRHGLIFDGQGGVTLIDLRDGRRIPLEGVVGDDSLLTSESPDGAHILFAWEDESVDAPNTLAMYELGLLDTETGVLTVLERENYQVRSETILGWLGNGSVAVLAFDENDTQVWYMYVYDFGETQS